MALFGRQRDINLFTTINRELLGDVITQQCAFYKYVLEKTTINIYGEAAEGAYYDGPTLFNCLIQRQDQQFPESDIGVDFKWGIDFKFLREDLIDASVVPEVGDIILYPDYPYEPNPLNPGLGEFGSNYSIICQTNYVPGDKPGITRERL